MGGWLGVRVYIVDVSLHQVAHVEAHRAGAGGRKQGSSSLVDSKQIESNAEILLLQYCKLNTSISIRQAFDFQKLDTTSPSRQSLLLAPSHQLLLISSPVAMVKAGYSPVGDVEMGTSSTAYAPDGTAANPVVAVPLQRQSSRENLPKGGPLGTTSHWYISEEDKFQVRPNAHHTPKNHTIRQQPTPTPTPTPTPITSPREATTRT